MTLAHIIRFPFLVLEIIPTHSIPFPAIISVIWTSKVFLSSQSQDVLLLNVFFWLLSECSHPSSGHIGLCSQLWPGIFLGVCMPGVEGGLSSLCSPCHSGVGVDVLKCCSFLLCCSVWHLCHMELCNEETPLFKGLKRPIQMCEPVKTEFQSPQKLVPYCFWPYKSHCQLHPALCISDYLCWTRSTGVGQPKACEIEVTWLLIRVQTPAGSCKNFLPRASTWRRPRVHRRQKWSLTPTQVLRWDEKWLASQRGESEVWL